MGRSVFCSRLGSRARGSGRKLIARVLTAVLLAGLAYTLSLPAARAAEKPLTHDDVTLLLLGGASSQKLIDLIKQRGIDFQMSAEIATEFRRDGADDTVIQALENTGKGTSQSAPSAGASSTAAPSTNTSSSAPASNAGSGGGRPTLIRHGESQSTSASASSAPASGTSGSSTSSNSSQSAPATIVGADGVSPVTTSGPSLGVPSAPDATQVSTSTTASSGSSNSSTGSASSGSSSGPTLVRHRAPVVSAAPQATTAAASPAPASTGTVPAATAAAAPAKATGLDLSDPSPERAQQIIQAFAAKEALFKVARDNYTYHQINKVEEIGPDGEVTGRYQQDWDILYDDNGSRIERVSYAPPDSLHQIIMTEQDLDAFRNIQPFVLTTAELPEYDVQYKGHVKVDELTAYVFSIRPKAIQKGRQYFQGLVWVDDRDLQIVKTEGKNVPETKNKGSDTNLFPRFTSWREQIDGKFWFPTYTLADDTLYFPGQAPVHVKEVIRYTDYKQFGSRVKIGDVAAIPNSQSSEPPKKPQDQKTSPNN
jgi:hypothetical protein